MSYLFTRLSFWTGLLGLVFLFQFLQAHNTSSPMPDPPTPPPAKPSRQSMAASGIVEAHQENTHIGVPLAALVTELKVKVWQKVKKGDVLMQLDDRELSTQLIGLQAELKVRQAELRKAEHRYQRLSQLGSSAAVARGDIEISEDEVMVAQAQVQRAHSQITEVQTQLERYTLRSPLDGTILQLNTRPGEHVSPGSLNPPLIIGDIDELQVRVDVDEQLAGRVKDSCRAVAYRKGQPEHPIQLSFVRIEPFIVPKKSLTGSSTERVDTRILPVIFRFRNSSAHSTYVGQQVDVFVEE
jgi:HlyD family secretion protein